LIDSQSKELERLALEFQKEEARIMSLETEKIKKTETLNHEQAKIQAQYLVEFFLSFFFSFSIFFFFFLFFLLTFFQIFYPLPSNFKKIIINSNLNYQKLNSKRKVLWQQLKLKNQISKKQKVDKLVSFFLFFSSRNSKLINNHIQY